MVNLKGFLYVQNVCVQVKSKELEQMYKKYRR